jgi:hypothetical protein
MDVENVDKLFMLMVGITSTIFLIITTYSFFVLIPENCTSRILHDGLTVIMVISAFGLTSAISYLYCSKYFSCYPDAPEKRFAGKKEKVTLYLRIGLVLSSLLLGLLVYMNISLKNSRECLGQQPNNTSEDKNRGKILQFLIWFMVGICSLGVIACSYGMYYVKFVPAAYALTKHKELVERKESENIFRAKRLAEAEKREHKPSSRRERGKPTQKARNRGGFLNFKPDDEEDEDYDNFGDYNRHRFLGN